jgi:Tfp pilus assembly protein PilZ
MLMLETDLQLGRYGITARLFKLISDMPKDKKLILLKQLIGDDVTAQLCKLIIEMSEEQQIILLEQLDSSMRENPRKPCLINANYRVQNKDFKSYILDISIGGVFIETNEKFTIGQKVELNFTLPGHSKPFKLTGTISWGSPRGFGMKFDGVPAQQGEILRSFVEQNE